MQSDKSIKSIGQVADGLSSIFKIVVAVLIFLGSGARAYWDISNNKKLIIANKVESTAKIMALKNEVKAELTAVKKKFESGSEKMSKIQQDVAVTRADMSNLTKKIDKMYELILEDRRR
ncbi:MAG: hypothetical protein NE330_23875 [Lentisphaeraceae bacterium]|nr:hypothetical protein [Lentisphaeraceae bacterium]